MRTYPAEPASNIAFGGETTKQYLYKVYLTLEEFEDLTTSGDNTATLVLDNRMQVRGILELDLTTTNQSGKIVIYKRTFS